MWRNINRMIDFGIWLSFFVLATVPVHEWFHWITGKALGGDMAAVTFPDLLSGRCSWHAAPDALWLVYLAGGLGTGLVFLALAWRTIRTPTRQDDMIAFSASIIGASQVGYGVGEMFVLWFPAWETLSTNASAIVALLIVCRWAIPGLTRWLLDAPAPVNVRPSGH